MEKLKKLLLHLLLKIKTRDKFEIKEAEIQKFIFSNRKSLSNVNTWIDSEAMSQSYFHYGVPDYLIDKIDLPFDNEYTYTDVISLFSTKLKSKICYLELGVSVGKNFYQLMNGFQNAELYGFDIENINPVLEKNLVLDAKSSFLLNYDSLRKTDGTYSSYSFGTNKINYLAGDIYDETCWEKLKGKKFNIIFSDALHEPNALLFEYNMLKKYDLLDNEFMIFWDDLNHGLERSFLKIFDDLKKKYSLQKKNVYLVKINGWLGQNEIKHDVGMISNIDFQ